VKHRFKKMGLQTHMHHENARTKLNHHKIQEKKLFLVSK